MPSKFFLSSLFFPDNSGPFTHILKGEKLVSETHLLNIIKDPYSHAPVPGEFGCKSIYHHPNLPFGPVPFTRIAESSANNNTNFIGTLCCLMKAKGFPACDSTIPYECTLKSFYPESFAFLKNFGEASFPLEGN